MLKNSSAASRLGSTAIYHQFHFWNRMLEISCMFWTEIFKIFAVKLSFCLPCPQIVSHGISWPQKKKVKNTWLRNKIIVLIRGNNFSIFLFKVLWLLSSIFPKYEKKIQYFKSIPMQVGFLWTFTVENTYWYLNEFFLRYLFALTALSFICHSLKNNIWLMTTNAVIWISPEVIIDKHLMNYKFSDPGREIWRTKPCHYCVDIKMNINHN